MELHLNSKHLKTLKDVFTDPVKSDIPWRSIENLFKALGGTITQGKGSRVRVTLCEETSVFHEPHPERLTDKGTVKFVREFLVNAGISYKDD